MRSGRKTQPGDGGPHWYLGLDGGNSKTVALVADQDGRIVGRGRAGVGDIYGVPGEGEAVGEVVRAVRSALSHAGLDVTDLRGATFCLAGVDWAEDEQFWVEVIAAELPGLAGVAIRNDGFALLHCGQLGGTGVAVTAGTGPAVAARGPAGQEYCASWWIQHDLGGRSLGEQAFRAVVDAASGLGPETALTRPLLALFGYPDVAAMLHAFTRRDHPRSGHDKRAAARQVLQAAAAGDAVAVGIVAAQAVTFAGLARVAAHRTGWDASAAPVPVVLGGSVLTSEHGAYRTALISELERQLGPIEVATIRATPVAGALLDAIAGGSDGLAAAVQDRVLGTVHPVDFLLT